jgi:hypothetical protein
MHSVQIPPGISVFVCAFLASAWSCRPCDRIEDGFNERLRDELAIVGAGTTVDTGITDHIRLPLSGPAFEYAAAPLGEVEVFRPAARQMSVRVPGAGLLSVEGELVARLLSVQAVAADDGDLRDRLYADGSRARRRDVDHRYERRP